MATAGKPPYKAWGNVPGGEQNELLDLRNRFEYLIGFTTPISTPVLLAMANSGVMPGDLRGFGSFLDANGSKYKIDLSKTPWAKYGLDKEEYASTSAIYSTQYKELTGQDINADALKQAFQRPNQNALLTGSQYHQQLMQDASIQKTYGWVKYGMDYSAWQAQKLQLRGSLGRDVKDSEASTILQYDTQARGSNQAVVSRVPQPQQQSVGSQGVGQSIVR